MAKTKKKFIIKNHQKRNRYLFLLLFCFLMLGIGYSNIISSLGINSTVLFRKYNTYLLYDVMKEAANTTTYARKYTGDHQDSYANTGTQDIYHWYGSNYTASTISNKNNVIFAGHCWQMIRTTDTGGVKMIYNGEAENNQCLSNRGTHIGYTDTYTDLGDYYYYGTSYEYDKENNKFTLSGIISEGAYRDSTASNFIGKYTCKSAVVSTSCSTLYFVYGRYENETASTLSISKGSHYSQFGTTKYAQHNFSLSYMGYMHANTFSSKRTNKMKFEVASTNTPNMMIYNYYYADSISYDSSTGYYTLQNYAEIPSSDDYSFLTGKYVITSRMRETTGQIAIYVCSSTGRSVEGRRLQNGDLDLSLTIGDSYTESGGVYTLTNPVTISYLDWYSNISDYTIYRGKYACKGNSNTCTELMHINPSVNASINQKSFEYVSTANNYIYAEDVSYDGTTHTLTGDTQPIWDYYDDDNKELLKTHRYTCFDNNNTTCAKAGYFLGFPPFSGLMRHIEIDNETNILELVNNQLFSNDVNMYDSTAKMAVDAWYAKYLSNYDKYIEDTVFCSDRTIKSLGAWDPTSGDITNAFAFRQDDSGITDISCDRETDMFSVSNPLAQLNYKVGLITKPELNILGNNGILSPSQSYWTMSPAHLDIDYATANTDDSSNYLIDSTAGIRPVISLKAGIKYTTGDGSRTSPYIVDVEPSILSLNKSSIDFTGLGGTSTIGVETNLEGTVQWESTDTSIATVDSNGVVTAVGYGVTTITAKLGLLNQSVTVSVKTYFEADSWETIILNVRNNTISNYHVGDTKKISMGSFGTHTLRIANTSTPSECENSDFSQTACGFVIEFADILGTRAMNSSNTNVGSWPGTSMRSYVNNTVYNALPEDLQNIIIDTTVITGHGSTSGEENFTSTDKLYLLAPIELLGIDNSYETLTLSETRQLDYYNSLGMSTSNYSGAIKEYNSSRTNWHLRSPRKSNSTYYCHILTTGYISTYSATSNYGVSPAFRIG